MKDRNNPSGYNWHARQMFGPDAVYDQLPPEQMAQVAEARMVYLRAKASHATKALHRRTAAKLRAQADALDAKAEGL